jgi:putative endonuclease
VVNKSLYRAFVYFMTNYNRTCYYVGVTNNLERRVREHRAGLSVFTNKYRLKHLVYYEVISSFRLAIQREKQLKNWKRDWKIQLIKSENPDLKDIAEDWY